MESYSKQTEKLTKAVLELNKRFDKAARYQTTKDNKDRSVVGRISSSLKSAASAKLREKFSLKGVGEMMGMGQGTLIGDILQSRHLQKEEERSKTEQALQFAKNRQKFNSDIDQGKLGIKEGVAIFVKQQELLKRLEELEDEISQAEKMGLGEAAKEYNDKAIEEIKQQLKEISYAGKISRTKPKSVPKTSVDPEKEKDELRKEMLMDLVAQLMSKGQITDRAVNQMELSYGTKLNDDEKMQLGAGIRQGMFEELLKSNEEQVKELKKLVAAAEPTLEEKLEARKNSGSNTGLVSKIIDKSKPGGSGAMDIIKNIFGMITSVMSPMKLLSGLKGVGGLALKAAPLIGGALMGGASLLKGAGTSIGKLIGLGGDTDAPKGIDGKEVGKPAEKAVGKQLGKGGAKGLGKSILKRLPGIGLLAGIGFAAGRMMDGDYVGAGMELASGAASTIPGIGTAASVAIDAGLAAKDSGAFANGETPTEISKAPETDREHQMAALSRNQKRLEEAKTTGESPSAGSTTVVTTNNSVNNVNKITKINAPVRNFDLSFNRRLDYALGVHTVGIRG